jgi:hypothetical protein
VNQTHPAVPEDTLAPLIVALGAMLLIGGVVWSPISGAVGLVLLVLGLARWIGQIWRA